MDRLYKEFILNHFRKYDKMLFIMGPRQVGKTTQSQNTGIEDDFHYFNWDDSEDREKIVIGAKRVADSIGLPGEVGKTKIIVFDEIHKFPRWKTFIKGFYDKYHSSDTKIIVTGSARLDTYRKGGDSLMGRYFKLRMHPLSVGELVRPEFEETEIRAQPTPIDEEAFSNLVTFGGFPEPFQVAENQFYTLWRSGRDQQLFREDLRDATRVQEVSLVETLAELLRLQTGQLVSYTSLSRKVGVSIDTIKRWLDVLKSLYYCYAIRPWTKNISRSLLKEPKFYLWDWSLAEKNGPREENIVASHLLKAIHFWADRGFGAYDLNFLRTKEKREVDFIVSKNGNPWFLVEVKSSGERSLSSNLGYFQKLTGAPHAFQVAFNADYLNFNCFDHSQPIIVPAKTFLSQLP